MRYGKLKNGNIEYAGKVIRLDDGSVVVAPKEADLLAAHYLPVVDEKPETDDAHYAAPTGWEERNGAIRRTYEIREKPPRPPRTFITADVIEGLMKAGVWPQVRAFIESRGMLDMVLATKSFSEDDPNFTGPRDTLKTELGWTDEQVEAVLRNAMV